MNRFRRVPRWLPALAVAAVAAVAPRGAAADPPPAVDVVLPEEPPPHRTLVLEWNPLALFLDRLSLNAVIVPGDHHALVLSPYCTWADTVPYATSIDSNGQTLPSTLNVLGQSFKGLGGELGYRYYLDKGGPRGFFAGPSLLLAALTATAGNGNQTSFGDIGVAVDAGYEALVANAVSISVGAGAQYTFTTKSIPDQQLPASVYANSRFYPRLLLALGYAF